MRMFRNIFLPLLLAVIAVSCQRRPFSENTTAVSIRLKIKTEVSTSRTASDAETMRIDLFDPETGSVVYNDYVSSEGGYIYPAPGVYDLLVYNIGTESTIVRNEQNRSTVEAYTNEVSAYIKAQMETFLARRMETRRQMAAGRAETKDLPTKDPVLDGTERIINEPDHLYVGQMPGLTIPAFDIGEERVISLEVEASSVVETWKITVSPVEGLQWVSSVKALITGQVESHFVGLDQKSEGVATVYFEMDKDVDNGALIGSLNTFGKNPDYSSFLSLDLNIVDNAGKEHHYHFDLTEQFFENDEYHLIVENPIVVEEPKVEGGGGFVPSVDEWDEVETEIIL